MDDNLIHQAHKYTEERGREDAKEAGEGEEGEEEFAELFKYTNCGDLAKLSERLTSLGLSPNITNTAGYR